MRDYGKVFSSIYESLDFRALSEDGRTLVLYLLTCKHGTIAGVFRVPDGYVCEDLQWSQERVAEGFRNIAEKGFATRCEVTKWVWVRKYLEWNPPENPNQRKAILKCVSLVPGSCSWKADFTREVGPGIGMEAPSKPNPCATLSEALPNQEQEQEQEYKPPKAPRGGQPLRTLRDWLDHVKAQGETPIPEDDPVFSYADSIGLPREFLRLAWREFLQRYTQPNAKRYRDWRATFRNAVRGNWMHVWRADGDGYALTTPGEQARRAHEESQQTEEAAT